MDAINGITIERYAELCAKMNDVIKDKDACIKIAASEGIRKVDWEAAHKIWQSIMTDPSDMGRTASAFEKSWHAALSTKN
ncbi:MAG: hypothetical protein IT281_01180 [Ignavibacteria bacterium]|nr:hypothetical protein [Ignavibacteria bacterium]MCC7158133.1 hypothetical protein [Ignavibacteria bacterium]